MADIIHYPSAGNQVATSAAPVDHFALACAPAKPTLDMLAKLRKVRNYLAECDRYDPNRNYELPLDVIPEAATLQRAIELCHEAEHVPAPEEWYYLAFGAYLAAAPNSGKVAPDYLSGLVFSIMNDEQLHKGYDELGFSFAVVMLAILDVRREINFVASAQEILEACQKHRKAFRDLAFDVEMMIEVRDCAEFTQRPGVKKTQDDDEASIPF